MQPQQQQQMQQQLLWYKFQQKKHDMVHKLNERRNQQQAQQQINHEQQQDQLKQQEPTHHQQQQLGGRNERPRLRAARTNWSDHSRINKHDHRAAGAMPPVKKYLFVSQVENTEEVEDVRNFLESNNIHPLEVEKISRNLASYHSFKVCVRISDLQNDGSILLGRGN